MTVEDRLRATTRAVTESMRPLRPLDLTQASAGLRPPAGPPRPRRWPGWLIPLAAAAAVVAVAVVLVVVRNAPRVAPGAGPGPAASRPGASAPAAAPADPEALPEYFVAISGLAITGPLPPGGQSGAAKEPLPDAVVVGDTRTGKRLATIKPPPGSTFAGVTGAADDGTFVLDTVAIVPGLVSANQQRTWYLLRVKPGAPVTTLTRLNFPLPAAADVNGIALSPDGTKIAVLYQVAREGDGFPYSGPFTLGIYSVATGAVLRTWTDPNAQHGSYGYGGDTLPDPSTNLTWTSDGQRVAFAYRSSTGSDASLFLREVNLAAPGGGLFTDSAVIAKIAVSPTTGRSRIWCDSLGITGDGRSAVCGAELPATPPVGATLDALTEPGPWTGCSAPTDTQYPGIVEISLAGDRLTRVLYEAEPGCMGGGYATVLWSSPSGDTVLGAVSYTDDPSMTEHSAVVLYDHGKVTPLSWPGAAATLLANQTAF